MNNVLIKFINEMNSPKLQIVGQLEWIVPPHYCPLELQALLTWSFWAAVTAATDCFDRTPDSSEGSPGLGHFLLPSLENPDPGFDTKRSQ